MGTEDRDAKDKDFPRLDHVFLIMMENHGYSQIINNPNAPFTNQWAKSANLATNYFAVAHPQPGLPVSFTDLGPGGTE
jgi:hypothetical protein